MKTTWLNIGSVFPFCVGFCPDKKAWKKSMKRCNISESEPFPKADGSCSCFTGIKDTKDFTLITINKKHDKSDLLGILALIAHECVHATDEFMDSLSEHKPSFEFRAYITQSLFMETTKAWAKRAGRLKEVTKSLKPLSKTRKSRKRS